LTCHNRIFSTVIRFDYPYLVQLHNLDKFGGPGRDRTFEGARPADLQSAPFDHFGTDPQTFEG
jgi:hypothetical protein